MQENSISYLELHSYQLMDEEILDCLDRCVEYILQQIVQHIMLDVMME